jgi:PhzF family phenazine biosynthesis protein
MESIPLYQVDAFTNQLFKGNPAGVCLLPKSRPDAWMQAVAAEMNLSETAFLIRSGADFNLRWFTPGTEIDLCGHATLASAHILWQTGTVPLDATIHFHTLSGMLTAAKQEDWIELNFPVRHFHPVAEIEGISDALGSIPEETFQSAENLLYVYHDPACIGRLRPNFAALKEYDFHGVIVTAPSDSQEFDFVSRFFAPSIGINEDPVTGSAHCTLAPFWQERLHKNVMIGHQLSARGGLVKVRTSAERVYISGQAVTVFSATLNG